ncbi:MAG: AbrB/MazE/SpoVT family DNA-binding domain-containing protein [Nitrospirota bacterium]
MAVTKIGPKHQITIPKEVFESLHLDIGDFLETQVKDNVLILIPKKLIPKDQEWFWTKEWQEKEKEADEAIKKGETLGPFSKASEAIKTLKKTKV